jgi:hypothetical protein
MPGGLRFGPVVEVDDAVVVEGAGGEGAFARCGVFGERARPACAGERVDEEMQLVDEAVGEQSVDERATAADVEVTVDVALQLPDRSGSYGARSCEFRQVVVASVEEPSIEAAIASPIFGSKP